MDETMHKTLLTVICAFLMVGCTTTKVRKVDASSYPIKLVCIETNPDVLVSDLVFVIESGFQRHGINTIIYRDKAPDRCDYTLWYTAFRGWDFAPFIKRVELRLRRGDETIASAMYNHKGGLALNKWASTETKLNPVIDELLSDFGSSQK